MRHDRRTPVIIAALLLAATTNCKTSQSINSASSEEQVPLSDAEKVEAKLWQSETEVGRIMAGRLLARYDTVTNKEARRYLATLGSYLCEHSGSVGRETYFAILNDETPAVYAVPGNYVLVTRGAVQAAHNEAELAGMLAKALAQLERKHLFQTVQQRLARIMNQTTPSKPLPTSWADLSPVVGAELGLEVLLDAHPYAPAYEEEAIRAAEDTLKRSGYKIALGAERFQKNMRAVLK